jgi:DNA (cytosine-5)-methyltransferase 1
LGEKEHCFNNRIAWDENVLQTLTAKLDYNRGVEKERITEMDIIHAQTFPEDYDFVSDRWNDVAYICGMSVPPIMVKRIVTRLIESGVFKQWQE